MVLRNTALFEHPDWPNTPTVAQQMVWVWDGVCLMANGRQGIVFRKPVWLCHYFANSFAAVSGVEFTQSFTESACICMYIEMFLRTILHTKINAKSSEIIPNCKQEAFCLAGAVNWMNMLKKAVKRVSLCRRLQGRQNSRSSRDSVLLPLLPLSLQCSSQVSVLSSCPLVPGACPGEKKKNPRPASRSKDIAL